MGDDVQPTGQQTVYPQGGISGRGNTSSRTMSPEWVQQDDVNESIESGYDWRPSGCRRIDLTIRQEPKSEKYIKKRKEEVYDLVNCGPRNRFLIRNHEGDVFVSHNSMGHGIDGLQLSGSIIVWYGVTWNLEHYEQMNGRLDRQGQKNSVSIIRILCKDSIDLAVADAINRKIDDQAGLKDAVDRYRRGEITNDMKLSFL
jgi:hypothetical protein